MQTNIPHRRQKNLGPGHPVTEGTRTVSKSAVTSVAGSNAFSDEKNVAAQDAIRVVIADDHPILRDGLASTFDREPGFQVIAQCSNSQEAIEVSEALLPDIIFLDIGMPGGGIAAARIISRRCPAIRIIVLSAHDTEHHVLEALRSGASGYVVKGVSAAELIQTARAVHAGEGYVSPALAAKLLSARLPGSFPTQAFQGFVDLNAREEQILKYVCEGRSNKEIGESIGLTEKTVKHYMTNILQKLHARNRVEAAMIAQERFKG